MLGNNSVNRIHTSELVVSNEECPDWVSGATKTPAVGDVVRCTAGLATVIKIHGKTGDGSRLIQMKPIEGDLPPFFAAASNILVKP
jgi:hypothetical protein